MALSIILKPEVPETFHRLKKYFDKGVYDKGETAMPPFGEFYLEGSGALAGEVISVYRDAGLMSRVIADSSGSFRADFEPLYKEANLLYAEGATSPRSNVVGFDVYYYNALLYLFSEECLDLVQSVAQGKQDLYIQKRVGDSIESLFDTERDEYVTGVVELLDKMPFHVPASYITSSGSLPDHVEAAVDIADKGLVHSALYSLATLFEGAGVERIFFWPQENYVPFEVDSSRVPRTKAGDRTRIIVPAHRRRFAWAVENINQAELDMDNSAIPGVPAYFYTWIYIDGTREGDESLSVKKKITQPLPGPESNVAVFASGSVLTDTDGSVTGTTGMRYVKLDPVAFSLESDVAVSIAGEDLSYAELISRSILALGVANVPGNVTVDYEYFSEPHVLCVCKAEYNTENIVEIHRDWNSPGHISPFEPYLLGSLRVYAKFASLPSNSVVRTLAGVVNNINVVSRPLELLITTSLDDQEVLEEDGQKWQGYFKGYSYWGIM